jgi:hypothetical protein
VILRRTFALALLTAVAATAPDTSGFAQETDLDRFMGRVLARRDENWKKLQQYVLEEQERFQLTGPDASRLYGFERDYTWFIRQGYFIRSPLQVDGVKIGEDERAREEARWLEREKAREKRAEERARARGENPEENTRHSTPASVEDVSPLQVRARPLRPRRARAAQRPRRPSHRVLPLAALQ